MDNIKSTQNFENKEILGSVVVDLLFYVALLVCGGSVLVFVLVIITLCPF